MKKSNINFFFAATSLSIDNLLQMLGASLTTVANVTPEDSCGGLVVTNLIPESHS